MQNKLRKFGYEKSPAVITVLVLVAIVISNLILTGDWLSILTPAQAEIRGSDELTINSYTTNSQTLPSVGVAGNGTQVYTWVGEGTGDTQGIWFRALDINGDEVLSETRVNDTASNDQYNPDISVDYYGNFVIAWAERIGSNYDIHLKAYKANGTMVGSADEVVTSLSNDERFPKVSLQYSTTSTNRAVVIWQDDPFGDVDIYQRVYSINFSTATITPYTSATAVNTYTTGNQTAADVQMNYNGDYVIAWTGPGPSTGDGWYRIYDRDGVAQTPTDTEELNFDTTYTTPLDVALAASPDTFIISYDANYTGETYRGAFARFLNCQSGISLCDLSVNEITVRAVSGTGSYFPKVGADQYGNSVVTWHDRSGLDGDGYGVFAQYIDRSGELVGSNFQVNTDITTGSQYEQSIGMTSDGTYAITWQSPDTGIDIKSQIYVSNFFKNGSEQIARGSADSNPQNDISVDVAPNGNIVMVWEDSGNIMMTLKDDTGAVINSKENVDIDGGTTSNTRPSVSFFKDTEGSGLGSFVVAWAGTYSVDPDIIYEIFSADGTGEGYNALNNWVGTQVSPDVAAGYYRAGGVSGGSIEKNFAAVWADNQISDVMAQFRSATGNSAFLYVTNSNYCPAYTDCDEKVSVDVDPTNNNMLVAYSRTGIDIYVQPYSSKGTVTETEQRITTAVGGDTNYHPDIAYMTYGDDYDSTYIVIYVYSYGSTVPEMRFKRYNGSGISGYLIGGVNTSMPVAAADTDEGEVLIVFDDMPTVSTDDNIYGFFIDSSQLRDSPYSFHINSTTTGNQFGPAVGMNNEGDVIVGWEGTWEEDVNQTGTTTDTATTIYQLMGNPLNNYTKLTFQPEAEQVITSGARVLDVPEEILFPQVLHEGTTCDVLTDIVTDPTAESDQILDVSVRGDRSLATPEQDCYANYIGGYDTGPTTHQYIELEDPDSNTFTLTVQASAFSRYGGGPSLAASDILMRNWDQDYTNTYANPLLPDDCSVNGEPETCFFTETSSASGLPTVTLHTDTDSFTALDTQKTLATKSGSDIGIFRFYPEFRLEIPPLTAPGEHTATITFTLS